MGYIKYKIWSILILLPMIEYIPTSTIIKLKVMLGMCADDGEPIRCDYCGAPDIETIPTDYINSIICEQKAVCKHCGETIGYWAYGHWNYGWL